VWGRVESAGGISTIKGQACGRYVSRNQRHTAACRTLFGDILVANHDVRTQDKVGGHHICDLVHYSSSRAKASPQNPSPPLLGGFVVMFTTTTPRLFRASTLKNQKPTPESTHKQTKLLPQTRWGQAHGGSTNHFVPGPVCALYAVPPLTCVFACLLTPTSLTNLFPPSLILRYPVHVQSHIHR